MFLEGGPPRSGRPHVARNQRRTRSALRASVRGAGAGRIGPILPAAPIVVPPRSLVMNGSRVRAFALIALFGPCVATAMGQGPPPPGYDITKISSGLTTA